MFLQVGPRFVCIVHVLEVAAGVDADPQLAVVHNTGSSMHAHSVFR